MQAITWRKIVEIAHIDDAGRNMNQKRALPTLEDVARAAGVSTATVSRVLNTPDKVTATTKKRVDDAVKELHYSPNFTARAIAANRTNTFGAIIPTMENAIFARGIEAFQNTLAENGATMLLASSGYDGSREEELIRTLVARGADGILLIGTDRSPEIYQFLEAQSVPFILCWTMEAPLPQSFVGFDNFRAANSIATQALALGHRNIIYVTAEMTGNDRARARYKGVQAAREAAGLQPEDMAIVEIPSSIKGADSAIRECLTQKPDTTLVICGNDVLAVGAIQAANALKLSVPDHLSITGFDDIELSQIMQPELTTVHVPHREMGKRAAEALLAMAENSEVTIRTELATYTVNRHSLAAPRR